MATWKHYFIPNTLQSAIEVLKNAPGTTRLIAGGTDLLLEIQQGHIPPVDNLVDINRIPEMQRLELDQDELVIGAAVPLKQIATSELVRVHATALSDASNLIGGPQVRNTATLGGNVSHALPAADGTIAMMALQPTVILVNSEGTRKVGMHAIFKGPGQNNLAPDEIVVEFRLPVKKQGQASGFSRIMRPQGVALPILNLAIWLERVGEKITQARIAVGPAGPVPVLCNRAAEVLTTGEINPDTLYKVAATVLEEVHYRTSPRRATAEYRKHITAGLLSEVFEKTWQRSFEN